MRSLGLALVTALATTALPAGAAAESQGAPLRTATTAQNGQLQLPVVEIHAAEEIVDDPKRDATMRVYDRDFSDDYRGRIGIELRGFTSQQDYPKKPYAIETRTDTGENRNVSLLGMPKDDDWVLIASYTDESLLRNFLAYSTARWLGRYAARNRLVEVVLNGEYQGVYLLAEDLKLHDDRVAVDDSEISGGYLLEMTSQRRIATSPRARTYFTTAIEKRPILYKDPTGKDLSHGRATWIRGYVDQFERRLYGADFRNRRRGYRRSLDMGAAVDYMLLNELFRNADTLRNSTYMYKSVGGKLVLGPLWDFDHAIGNDGTPEDNDTTGWEYTQAPWAERLYADPAFVRWMATRWRTMREYGLLRHLKRTIDSGASQLAGGPQERNFSRWPVFGTPVARPPDPRTGAPPANHAQAVDYLKWWVVRRVRWIDQNVNSLRP